MIQWWCNELPWIWIGDLVESQPGVYLAGLCFAFHVVQQRLCLKVLSTESEMSITIQSLCRLIQLTILFLPVGTTVSVTNMNVLNLLQIRNRKGLEVRSVSEQGIPKPAQCFMSWLSSHLVFLKQPHRK